jgi:uncharacterized protein
MQVADGVIVASSLKRNGRIKESINPIRVAQFVEAAQQVNISKERSQSKPSLKLTL